MKNLRSWCLLLGLVLAAEMSPAQGAQKIPALVPVSEMLSVPQRTGFTQRRQELAARLAKFQADVAVFNGKTAENQSDREYDSLMARKADYILAATDFNDDELAAETPLVIAAMKDLVRGLGWSTDEQARFTHGLGRLPGGNPSTAVAEIDRVWRDMIARGSTGLAREAAGGGGPGFPGAGTQTNYSDCAVFALANAAGIPYGAAAARAAQLIAAGAWRSRADRADPQKAIEGGGLMGGEVLMLAEALGQAEVVPIAAFVATLRAGRPIMVNVIPEGNTGGHEVVLTKTFQRAGETWYELMDSNEGPIRRLHLSAGELNTILQENGVAFRPDPGTTPQLLR